MADEELRITATLNDQASAGLARLQANMRQLGSGPQAQAMESMRRQSGEVAKGLTQLSGGFGSSSTAMLGFMGIAAAVPVALAGIAVAAVSAAAVGVNAFADNLNQLGRQARETGASLAQYKANIETLRSAGISEQEAAAMIKRFTDVQEDLSTRGSKIRQGILAATPLEGRNEMQAWLNNVMVAPAEQAMAMVQQRGEQIRNGAAEQARAQAQAMGLNLDEQNAYAEREGAKAQRRFLSMFGAEALEHVRAPFREATKEEIALQKERLVATQKWGDATSQMGAAWRDMKETIGSILIGPMTAGAEAMARWMRTAADAARVIEAWFKAPGGEGIISLVRSLEEIPALESTMKPIREFMENPSQGLLNMVAQIKQEALDLLPKWIVDWFNNPGQGMANALRDFAEGVPRLQPMLQPLIDFFEADRPNPFAAMLTETRALAEKVLPQSVIDFFTVPPSNDMPDAMTRVGEVIKNWGTGFIEFWNNPKQGFYDDVNKLLDQFEKMGKALMPVTDFFRDPAQGLLNMVNQISEKMQNLMPDWMRRWLGVGTAAATPEQAPQAAAAAPIMVPPAVQQQLLAEAPQPAPEPILVPPAVQRQLQAEAPEAPQRSRWDPRSWFGRQEDRSADANRPSIVGERGPEPMVPRAAGDVEGVREIAQLRDLLGLEDRGEAAPWQNQGVAVGALEPSAAQQVNVSGSGRISVDVRAPEGTRVEATGEGLFKTTEIMRQTQMMPADYGPAAATGVNAGTGSFGAA